MSSTAESEAASRSNNRTAFVITFFPMLIAVLSLVTSIYNGYLNNRFVTLIQGNLSRAESMRTCRDAIDAYFQVKYRADVLARAGTGAEAGSPAAIEAGNAVARFGALATYLANLRDEAVRQRYTDLYWKLDTFVAMAATKSADERARVLKEADAVFASLNADCIKSASAVP